MVNPVANAGAAAKSIAAFISVVPVILMTVFPHVDWQSIVTAVSAGLVPFGVYLIPNTPNQPKPAVAV